MREIILGPPGCGKTTTLLDTVDEGLTNDVAPDRIGYFSFTRRAADEAVNRAVTKFNFKRSDLPHFRTLHSHCFTSLSMRRDNVFQGKKIKEFAQKIGIMITGRFSEDGSSYGYEDGDRILHMINLARVRCIPLRQQYDQDDDDLSWSLVEYVDQQLRTFKETEGLFDYTDMLSEYLSAGPRPQFDILILDEAQDNSQLQWRVFHMLEQRAQRIIIAGDDDQAIYPWAGADVNHFINLEGAPRVLGQSWRVPRTVQALAATILADVTNRRPKEWAARKVDGAIERTSHFGLADINGNEDTLILTRNIYLLREQVEPELRRRGIIYKRTGDKFDSSSIPASTRNAITYWEMLRRGQAISAEQARMVYEKMEVHKCVKWGFKGLKNFEDHEEVTLELLKKQGGLLTDAPWFEALKDISPGDIGYIRSALAQGQKLTGEPRVTISTIHSSKGGQADHVVLLREMARRTFKEYEHNPEDEARVWYVGATRAKEKLTLVYSETAQEYPI